MLKLTFGLWRSKEGHLYGNFTVFGRKFIVFLNDVPEKANMPEYSVTIQESKDAPQDRH